MSEEWKPIPSAPGWRASSLGRVCRPSIQLPMPNGGTKTLYVAPTYGRLDEQRNRFKQGINDKTRWVAVVVCEAFHGLKPDPSLHCLHIDENSTNNVPSNLEWGTRSRNQSMPGCKAKRSASMTKHWADAAARGFVKPWIKLTADQVRAIRRETGSHRELAERYNVAHTTIALIREGKTWRHLL